MKKLENLVVLTLLVLATTIIISFTLAFIYKHVTYFLPYISDSGALPPESGYFGLGMNFIWILLSYLAYIKYLQVDYIVLTRDLDKNIERLNLWTLRIGLLAAFGASLVGNFQETTMFVVHWIGAVLIFGVNSIYIIMQTIIYFKLMHIIHQVKRTYLRATLSVVSLITFMIFLCAGMTGIKQFEGEDMLKWKQSDGGFELHQASSISEWICAFCTGSYYVMYYWELKTMSLSKPTMIVNI